MNLMIPASLVMNVVILVPVCAGLITEAGWVSAAYGTKSPARAILLSVYIAILLVSCALLFWKNPAAVASLFLVQILYKVITPIAVGSIAHPVVATNLFVAAFHTITLVLIWMSAGRVPPT